ncbi:hypothetical protein BDV06DRAFT_38228 [Aspergillus oleicola]
MKISLLAAVVAASQSVTAALSESNLETFVGSLELTSSFNPVEAAYWTGYKHHRRTPFAVSPDGESAYLAYLDSSETDVHVQKVNPSTFKAVGSTVTVSGGKEAGGLVAHNDGFALLTNEAMPSGTTDAPADNTPVPVLYRYTDGKQTWKTWLGGPDVSGADGHLASPDINGDLVYSSEAGLYGAYFVVTAYSGSASGHYGDSIQYVNDSGELQTIDGATSTWGCSHNTGIAFEEASDAPFASICAEDQGAIWLNTKGQGMTTVGVKISNENTTNGASGEPMGGMGGSYSALVKLGSSSKYLFAWPSRGAIDVTTNEWMGDGYTNVLPRNLNRNVAVALFSDKNTLVGQQATSEIGASSGDSQINWVTEGSADHSNVHAAAFGTENVLLTWEQIDDPTCDEFIAMGCKGAYSGTYFQQVDSTGVAVGAAINSSDIYVAGDMVNVGERICWPYVAMEWDLEGTVNSYGGTSESTTEKISFACIGLSSSGSSSGSGSSTASASVSASGTASASASGTVTATVSASNTGSATGTGSLSLTASETAETQAASQSTETTAAAEATSTGVDAVSAATTSAAAEPEVSVAVTSTSTATAEAEAATATPTKRPGKGKGKCRAHYKHSN